MGRIYSFSMTLVQRKCENCCPDCYVPAIERREGKQFTPSQIDTVFGEAEGASSVKLLLGEVKDQYAGIVLASLRNAQEQDIRYVELITSGINLSEADLDRMCEVYTGKLDLVVSVDGPWLHDNYGPQTRNGDVLPKFINVRDEHKDHVKLTTYWTHTHLSSFHDEELRDSFKQRCIDLCVPFEWNYEFWTSCEGDDEQISALAGSIPYGHATVAADPEQYRLVYPSEKEMSIGRVGALGTGGIRKILGDFSY